VSHVFCSTCECVFVMSTIHRVRWIADKLTECSKNV
jgi:hypothetical protein